MDYQPCRNEREWHGWTSVSGPGRLLTRRLPQAALRSRRLISALHVRLTRSRSHARPPGYHRHRTGTFSRSCHDKNEWMAAALTVTPGVNYSCRLDPVNSSRAIRLYDYGACGPDDKRVRPTWIAVRNGGWVEVNAWPLQQYESYTTRRFFFGGRFWYWTRRCNFRERPKRADIGNIATCSPITTQHPSYQGTWCARFGCARSIYFGKLGISRHWLTDTGSKRPVFPGCHRSKYSAGSTCLNFSERASPRWRPMLARWLSQWS